jgi:hypothetical protein
MPTHDAKLLTVRRFTNLLDGGILPKVSVYEILDYYEDLKIINRKKANVLAVKNNCNITNNFLEDEIQEYEEEYGEL